MTDDIYHGDVSLHHLDTEEQIIGSELEGQADGDWGAWEGNQRNEDGFGVEGREGIG